MTEVKKTSHHMKTDDYYPPNIKNHLQAITATLVQCPTFEDLVKYIPEFVSMTWLEDADQMDEFLKTKNMTREDVVMEMFNWRTLPTAWETVRVTFRLTGLDITNVTHYIRHRLFSFSAQTGSDPIHWSKGLPYLMNDAFIENKELHERMLKLIEDANDLYFDAIKSGMNHYDARSCQLRCREEIYFMSGNLKDFISLIRQRMGTTNQTPGTNIVAYRMREQLLKQFPFLEKQMPLEPVQPHYISAINEKFNMNTYPPNESHQKVLEEKGIDWSNAAFALEKPRDDYDGNQQYADIIAGKYPY